MAGSGAFPKVTGDLIYLADYTAVYNVVTTVLGVGSGTSGYGATPSSSALTGNPVVGSTAWNNLRADINACRTHQAGAAFTNIELPAISTGGVIDSAITNLYKTQADVIATNKDTAFASTQLAVVTGPTTTYSTAWNGSITTTATVTFASADNMRNFFNAGGRLRILASATGGTTGTDNTKDKSWADAILAGNTNILSINGYYTATNYRAGGTYTLWTLNPSGPAAGPTPNNYSASFLRASATLVNSTTVTLTYLFNDASVRTAPAVDENVTASITVSFDYLKSVDAVVSPIPNSYTVTRALGP